MEMDLTTQVLVWGGGLAALFGAVAAKTGFCTMGAVADWVNMGDTGRMRSWCLATGIALAGVLIFEFIGSIDLAQSRIPYRSAGFAWPRYLLGGLMFGVGMTLCGGCGAKNLIRFGGGNLKSLVVIAIAAVMAWFMTRGDLYALLFHSWIEPLTPNLKAFGADSQDIGSLAGIVAGQALGSTLHYPLGAAIAAAFALWALSNRDFRRDHDQLFAGVVVGLVVIGGWFVTGGPLGREWMEYVSFLEQPPQGAGMQSYTFINPMGEALSWALAGGDASFLTFGVAAFLGVIGGSFVYSILTGNFRIEWFHSVGDFVRHIVGAVLIGIGGVLGLGCTIGQAVTGVSTLALGSFLTFGAIILGGALSLKVQYYRLLHEEAPFGAVLATALADLRLLPRGFRRLDA